MHRLIQITTKGGGVEIDGVLFRHIFESSIISNHPHYLASLESGKLTLSDLISLSRQGGIAYSLFFGTNGTVSPLINKESASLFGGFGDKYSLGVRGRVFNLNVIRLLIKDIKMKQDVIMRFVKTEKHPYVKFLKNSKRSLRDQADYIVDSLRIDMNIFRSYKDKRDALMYLIDRAEANNIFISIENTGTNMPQNFKRATGLTGVYIQHNKFPYIFISKEGMADPDKTPARKVFTLVYLLACLFKGHSKMVSLNQAIGQEDSIFELTELILMPADLIPLQSAYSIDDLDAIADTLNVSSSAILTRLDHLGYIKPERRDVLRDALSQRYSMFAAQQRRKDEKQLKEFRHNTVNNIRIYQGKAYLRILHDQYIAGNIKRKEINRQLSYRGKGSVDFDGVFKGL